MHGRTHAVEKKKAETIGLGNAHSLIAPIAFFNNGYLEGTNLDLLNCTLCIDSSKCIDSVFVVYATYAAYTAWPRTCEYIFGGDNLLDCKFCIRCYFSVKLSRCFECDACRSCSDCYFCHNVENCTECMFCFNVKAKRYAVGNVEYQKEEYLKIKKLVLAEIGGKLEKDKKLDLSIYNIGGQK